MSETGYQTPPTVTRVVWFAVSALILLLAGAAVALWSYYGTTVFYEMILAGIAACF